MGGDIHIIKITGNTIAEINKKRKKVFSVGCRRMSLSSQLAASVMLSISLFCVAQGQRASDIPRFSGIGNDYTKSSNEAQIALQNS